MALGTPGSAAKVRRRLDFARKPLEGESLYLDLPGYKNAKELEEDLKFLGARIETFLTKDISYVVTNRKEALSHDVRPASPYPSPSPSPGGDEGVPGRKGPTNVPLTRGQALLQKAQGRGRRGSCNMLSLAQEWGVKVLYVRDVLARVQRLMEKYRSLAENEENTACAEDNPDVKPRRLRPPFIKVEDMSRQYRPIHHEFTSLPRIYFDSDGECPFDPPCRRPSRPICPLDVKPRTPVSAIKPQTPVGVTKPQTPVTATKPDIKRGYCECCEAYYQDGLRQHLQGDKHKSFVRDSGNFVKLDALLATLPSLDNFLKNVVVENAQKEQSPPQETSVSDVIHPVQEPADKQRSNGDASDEVSLLSSGGEGSAHGQTGQQSTYKMSKQQTKHPNNQEPKTECGGPDKLLTLKDKETQNGENLNKEERIPVVVLSPLPDARFSVGTNRRNNSISVQPRDETSLKRTTGSTEGQKKCKAPKEKGVVDKNHGCSDDVSDGHVTSDVVTISSDSSSSFSIDASSSESSPSSSCSSSSTNGTSFMSTGGSSYPSVFEDSPTITSVERNGKSKAINKEQKGKPLKNQSKSEQGTSNGTSGWRNIAGVNSSSSGSEDFSSSSSDASSSSSSLGLQRQKRRGSGVLQYTSPSSDQHRSDSSPQTERSTLKHNCEDVMQCCDPLTTAKHTYTPKHHLATSVRAAAWIVTESDDLTLRLCKTGGGDGNELVSPPRPEWSVERSGKLRLKLQRSSCQATTPKNGPPASELKWSVHRSGDCRLTFSGSLRKQQRRPGFLDSPQTARSFGSRRKLKYV